MTLDCALHDAIFAVLVQVSEGQMPIDRAADVLDCLYQLMRTSENKELDKEIQSRSEKAESWLTKEQIASKFRIFMSHFYYSPAISAVGAIISHLSLEPEEVDGYDPDVPYYSPSAIQKIHNWLKENNYPEVIMSADGTKYHVYYDLGVKYD